MPKNLSRGFIFPDVVSANDWEVKEAYRYKVGNTEVIGWYFESTFRQDFDFNKYPVDDKDIQIRLWHQDFNRPDLNRLVILVPDLESYNVMNPTTKPGVYKNIALNGWTLPQSFFEYQFKSYDTNFGFTTNGTKRNFPELTFNLILKRNFLSLFISTTGPLIIVVTLLFAMLLIANRENIVRAYQKKLLSLVFEEPINRRLNLLVRCSPCIQNVFGTFLTFVLHRIPKQVVS